MLVVSEVKTVGQYEVFFETGIKKNGAFERVYEINKNLSYGFSYIEYLTKRIREEGNFVIKSQLYKSYIVTGMGIVECILHYLIKSMGLNKTIIYKEISRYKSNSKELLGEEVKVETLVSIKLNEPEEDEITLDKMIKIAQKHKLLGPNQENTYSKLGRLRKLRNKVHLHISDYLEHDFNSFTMREAIIMREILIVIICSDLFASYLNKSQLFDFLKLQK